MANPKCPASKKSKPTKKPSKKQAVNLDPDRFVDAHAHELMLGTYVKRKPLYEQEFKVTPELVACIVELPRVSHPTYPYRKSHSPSFDSIALLLFGFPCWYRDREPLPFRFEESASSDADTDADDTDAYADSSTDDAGPSSAAS
ncbi:hypothetical protein CJ030_MR6G013687 [Morella rubra]|uniref:Uncharacterized protein n=1 Tax=Morella rubra TaxID=262757 RepID=A0A6A1VDD3_9ROSI|nr:hypothetical protein CJ030_MR6G013687 [Morella rubra]